MSAVPDWITYDEASDVLTIHGKRYAAGLFCREGFLAEPGTVIEIVKGAADVVTAKTIIRPAKLGVSDRKPVYLTGANCPAELIHLLGLPKHTRRFSLHCAVGEIAHIEVEFHPEIVLDEAGELLTQTKRYQLQEIEVCPNCETAMPDGCGGTFLSDGQACWLNRGKG